MEGKHVYEESAWLMQRQTKAGKFFFKKTGQSQNSKHSILKTL